MQSILLRWAINVIAVFVASFLLPDLVSFDDWVALAIFAAVLGLINAVIKPIVTILALPAVVLTLGLFIFIINALLFGLAGLIVPGFHVEGFLGALLGSLIVSLVSWLLSIIIPDSR